MARFPRLALLSAAGLGFLAPLPASAALPPKYQRLAELRAVLEHVGIQAALGEGLVDRVEYVRNDLYRVHAGRCHVEAAIIGLPTPRGISGPRRFEVRPGGRVCR